MKRKKSLVFIVVALLITTLFSACGKQPGETSATEKASGTNLDTTEADSSSDGSSEEVTSGETLFEPESSGESAEATLPVATENTESETEATETAEARTSEIQTTAEATTAEAVTKAAETTKAPEPTAAPTEAPKPTKATQPATKAPEPTKAPQPTTKAPEPTKAPETKPAPTQPTTKAPEPTKAPETTKAAEPTTKAPEPTTKAPEPTTAAPTTESPKPTWTVTITAPKHQECVQRGYGSIAGAVYGLYKNGTKIGTYTTGSNGGFTAGPFEVGSGYELRLEKASEGYMIDGDWFDERHYKGRVGIYKGGAITYSLGTEAKNYSFMNESCSIQKVDNDVNAFCAEMNAYAESVGLYNIGHETGCYDADEYFLYGHSKSIKEDYKKFLRYYAEHPMIEGVYVTTSEHYYKQESETVGLAYEIYQIRAYYG